MGPFASQRLVWASLTLCVVGLVRTCFGSPCRFSASRGYVHFFRLTACTLCRGGLFVLLRAVRKGCVHCPSWQAAPLWAPQAALCPGCVCPPATWARPLCCKGCVRPLGLSAAPLSVPEPVWGHSLREVQLSLFTALQVPALPDFPRLRSSPLGPPVREIPSARELLLQGSLPPLGHKLLPRNSPSFLFFMFPFSLLLHWRPGVFRSLEVAL